MFSAGSLTRGQCPLESMDVGNIPYPILVAHVLFVWYFGAAG